MSDNKDIGAAKEFAPSKQDLALIDEQLAQEAAQDMKMAIARPTGNRIKPREDKTFVLPDGTIHNSLNVVIVDFITYHRWYLQPYKEGENNPPVCFAFGKYIDQLSPLNHKDSKGQVIAPEPQADACGPCPWNQWESNRFGGKGKDCQQRREVVVILEQDLSDPHAPLYTMSVSPTGVKNFDNMISAVSTAFGAPIKAVVHVTLNPQVKYAQMVFSDAAENREYAMHVGRRGEARAILEVPPDYSRYTPAAKPARGAQPQRAGLPRR